MMHAITVVAGSELPEVQQCQWCVELWNGGVWDMVPGTQALWQSTNNQGIP